MTEGDNDESVEDLLERAESMIRENMQQSNRIPATSVAAVNNGWIQTLNSQEGSSVDIDIDSILVNSGHNCTNQTAESTSRKFRN